MTSVRSVGRSPAAASSCSVPITVRSCSCRAARPGSGNCGMSACTTASTADARISVLSCGVRRSASTSVISEATSGGGVRVSMPTTRSTSGSASSARARPVPQKLATPVMRIRRAGTRRPESIFAPAMPIHVHPTAELAPRALLPGDPGRALALAQVLLDEPRMFNHNRGLWGYTGPAKADGAPLTIQSTGMGGPSAAIVVHELIELGLQTALRVGTCGALVDSLSLGDLVVACEALAEGGPSRALGAG